MHHDETSAAAPAHGRLLETDARREALARLTEGLGLRAPFLLVTGEPGVGKTALMRDAITRWGEHAAVAFVANAAMTRTEFVEHVLRRFGVDPPADASKPQLLDRVEKFVAEAEGRGQVPVIVIDDAHELPDELLGELRLLANASVLTNRPLEIALVGLPVLDDRLAEPALQPVRQRISVRCQVPSFTQHETRRYLSEIVGATQPEGPEFLPRKTCREIFKRTSGIPRAIDTLVAEAMRRARASRSRVITPELAADVASDLRMGGAPASAEAPPSARVSSATVVPASRPQVAESAPMPKSAASAPVTKPIPASAAPPNRPSPTQEALRRGSGSAAPAGRAPNAPPVAAETPRASEPAKASRTEPANETRAASKGDSSGPPMPADPPAEPAVVDTPATADHSDPRVGEWIGRFIKPDEPRFGELLMVAIPSKLDAGRASESAMDPKVESKTAPRVLRPETRAWEDDDRLASPDAFEDFTGTHGIAWETDDPTMRELPPLMRSNPGVRREPKKRTIWHRPAMPRSVPIAGGLVAVVFVAALVMLPRGHRTVGPPAPTDTTGAVANASSDGKRTTSARAGNASKKATAPTPTTADAEKAPEERYSLDVGMYLNPDRAEAERDRIVEATGLRGWLVRGTRDGADMYHVIVGSYRTRERAQQSAEQLLERGMVFEALVVPLPAKNQRR